MRILVEPKPLPAKITKTQYGELVNDMEEEWSEVTSAIAEYVTDPTPKNREHLMEEYGDLITVVTNNMIGLERLDPPIKNMAWAGLQKVVYKNYGRGYHNRLADVISETIVKIGR